MDYLLDLGDFAVLLGYVAFPILAFVTLVRLLAGWFAPHVARLIDGD